MQTKGGITLLSFFSASVLQDSSESAHSTDLKSTTIEETRGAASSSDADDNRCFTEAGLLLQKSGVRFTAVDTIRKTVSAVRGLQSWLRTRFAEDHRRIEDMPPAELDEYLAEFFSDIKTRDGGEYHPSSFNSLRSAIERYLQQKDYGYSIISSSVFKKSQQSYKARKASLYKQRQVTEFINESLQPPTN
ncbi:uncharacterized protein LOC135463955 [Liolophura sinensis]|uniref:uncharacterized protein LOC135463955 n=1 Tax=Liolophura sinensis TaxID=3198878 RepID=UPI0031597162